MFYYPLDIYSAFDNEFYKSKTWNNFRILGAIS